MDDEIDLGVEQCLGIGLVVEMGRDFVAAPVGVADDGLIDVRLHLGGAAEIVVHADLDPVDLHGGVFVNHLARRRGSRRVHDLPGDIEAGPVEVGRLLSVAYLHPGLAVAAETINGGHPVARIQPELIKDILFGIEFRLGLESFGGPHVRVRVDHARHDRLARDVNLVGRGRRG